MVPPKSAQLTDMVKIVIINLDTLILFLKFFGKQVNEIWESGKPKLTFTPSFLM